MSSWYDLITPSQKGIEAAVLNQLSAQAAPLMNPNGFTFTNFKNLQEFWDFTQGSLPSPWNIVLDNGTNYAPVDNEYTADQVKATAGGVLLGNALSGGSPLYKGGLIGTINGGSPTVVGTPTYTLPQAAARVRYLVKGPSFAGNALASGLWWGAWAVSIMTGATDGLEIDATENNPGNANGRQSDNTLHQWKPTVWQSPGTGTSLPGIASRDMGLNYHYTGFIWEPGKVTFELDNVAVAQWTAAQQGASWTGIDGATNVYLLLNSSIDSTGIIGPAWNTANNAALATMNKMSVAGVWVYTT